MTLIHINREQSIRVYLSYRGNKLRLALIKYGKPAQIVAMDDDVARLMQLIKEAE